MGIGDAKDGNKVDAVSSRFATVLAAKESVRAVNEVLKQYDGTQQLNAVVFTHFGYITGELDLVRDIDDLSEAIERTGTNTYVIHGPEMISKVREDLLDTVRGDQPEIIRDGSYVAIRNATIYPYAALGTGTVIVNSPLLLFVDAIVGITLTSGITQNRI